MADALRNMSNRGESAREMAQQSQQLRNQAQKLLNSATPEQRQSLERLARQMANQSNQSPGDAGAPSSNSNPNQQANQQGQNQSGSDDTPASASGAVTSRGSRAGPVATQRQIPYGHIDLDTVPKEKVNLRTNAASGEGDRVIAQWDAPPKPGETATSSGPGGSMNEGLKQAAQSAERAIEQRSVPPQYNDLVRRVFRRYVERSASPAAQPKPAAQPNPADPQPAPK